MRAGLASFGWLPAVLLSSSAVPAQEWHISTEAGRIRMALDPTSAMASVSLGLRYEDASTGLRLSAGIPTRSDEALWGGAGVSKRLAFQTGSLMAGLDLLGNALTLHNRQRRPLPLPGRFEPPTPPGEAPHGHALAGQVMPVIGYDGTRLQLRARAGVSRYVSRIVGQERDRLVRLADVQATYLPAFSVAIVPALQHVQPQGEPASVFAGASIVAARSSGSVWAMVGQWVSDTTGVPQWNVGARWRLHPNVSFDAAARCTTHDPLYRQPAQTSWSVGLSILLGRARTVEAPVPAAYVRGRALIRLPISASKSTPSIAGDFNGWKPAPMQRDGDQWTYTVAIPPGVYSYAFVSAAGEWFVPEGVPGRRSDGMGGHVAVLVVR